MNKKRLIGYLFVMVSCRMYSCAGEKVSAQEYKLWYDRPAQVWTEALPFGKRASGGNGIWNAGNRTNTTKRRNHLGRTPQQQRKPERTGYIPKVRELVFAGKYLEAQTLATEKVMAKTNSECLIRVSAT